MKIAFAELEPGLGPVGLLPATPIRFASRPREKPARALARAVAESRALEVAACRLVEQFLASSVSPAVKEGGMRGGTLTRLDVLVAGLAASPARDLETTIWLARLHSARAALRQALARERRVRSGSQTAA